MLICRNVRSWKFESDVISDGTQIAMPPVKAPAAFESDVISDGTQIPRGAGSYQLVFESDVISDGTQIFSLSRIA